MKSVTEELHKAMVKARKMDHLELEKTPEVQQRDVVSLAEARQATGYVESLGYSLKKMVWS